MSADAKVLFCHCSYSGVLNEDEKNRVFAGLKDSGVEFEDVPDLCELSAKQDPRLKEYAEGGPIKIAACYERAVKWLFHSAKAPLDENSTVVHNMREETAETIVPELTGAQAPESVDLDTLAVPGKDDLGEWKPWFPVIDYDRCTNCMQCLSFCLFDVYSVDEDDQIKVQTRDQAGQFVLHLS